MSNLPELPKNLPKPDMCFFRFICKYYVVLSDLVLKGLTVSSFDQPEGSGLASNGQSQKGGLKGIL